MSVMTIIFLVLIVTGIFLCFLRLLYCPTASDRAVALDTLTTTVFGFIFERYVYLDVSLVYSVLSFVGLVALARFLERGI